MKFSKSIAAICALIAAVGIFVTSQNEALADGIATTTTQGPVRLYTSTGDLISNRGLAPNTKWAVGEVISINNETFYQVATNEYLKAADSSLSGNTQTQPDQTALIGTVVTPRGTLTISKALNDFSNNPGLPQGSQWQIGKYIVNRLGKKYVQVSADEYVPVSHMTYNHALPEPTSDPDFYYYWQMDPNLNPGYTPHSDY